MKLQRSKKFNSKAEFRESIRQTTKREIGKKKCLSIIAVMGDVLIEEEKKGKGDPRTVFLGSPGCVNHYLTIYSVHC
jgi:hypothetical protein